MVSMAGLPARHAPGRVAAVEGGIEARLGASSIAGSTDAHDRHSIPPILTTLVGRLAEAVPRRARATFTELLIGAATTRGGHVTDAILAAGLSRSWTTYYWLLQRGRWTWLAVWQALWRRSRSCSTRRSGTSSSTIPSSNESRPQLPARSCTATTPPSRTGRGCPRGQA